MNYELPKLRPKVTTFFVILQTFFIFFYFFFLNGTLLRHT